MAPQSESDGEDERDSEHERDGEGEPMDGAGLMGPDSDDNMDGMQLDEEEPSDDDVDAASVASEPDADEALMIIVASLARKWRGNGIDIRFNAEYNVIGRISSWGPNISIQCMLEGHTRCRRSPAIIAQNTTLTATCDFEKHTAIIARRQDKTKN